MAAPSTSTVNWDAIASTTLNNMQTEIEDNISTANALFHFIMKEEDDAYEGEASLGQQIQIQLMYALGRFDSYSGYDTLGTSPTDGITSAFWPWRQAAIPIMISRIEERQNSGENRIINLLKAKTKQAVGGIQEGFAKAFLQGEGFNNPTVAGNIETNYLSPSNGSSFIDPLALLVKKDPTTSTVVGNLNQSTATWWRNVTKDSQGATFQAIAREMKRTFNDCSKGSPAGGPTLLLGDQASFECYENGLALQNQYVSTKKADIPFDNIAFRGKPFVWDEFIPNVEDRVVAQVATKGSIYFLNTKHWKIKYDKLTNFMTTPFEKAINQDAKVAQIMWYGGACLNNRRKQGVMWGIDTTVTA